MRNFGLNEWAIAYGERTHLGASLVIHTGENLLNGTKKLGFQATVNEFFAQAWLTCLSTALT